MNGKVEIKFGPESEKKYSKYITVRWPAAIKNAETISTTICNKSLSRQKVSQYLHSKALRFVVNYVTF